MADSSFSSPLRRFFIIRTKDPSGIAGTGRIVEGVVMPSGRVYLEWRGPVRSRVSFDNWKDFAYVYLHAGHGCNEVVWVDPEP